VAVNIYGTSHQQKRDALKPTVDAGNGICAETICLEERDGRTRWIKPGTQWHLAHDPTDPSRTTYLGPAHARCNTSEGATRGNRARNKQERRWTL
jgi:hypothetical protein